MTGEKDKKASQKRHRRFVPLRIRFITLSCSLLLLLLGSLAILIGAYQSRSIRSQLVHRAVAIAESVAAASQNDLTIYNYIPLEQNANQVARDPEIKYVIIHDKEGRVAGYSGHPERQQTFLDDEVTARALAEDRRLVQDLVLKPSGEPIVEVSVPVHVPQSMERWGTVRVAMSLAPLRHQIHQTQLIIAMIGLVALIIGALVSIVAANRITRPLGRLVDATVEAAKGNLDQKIRVATGDEVEILATNFQRMTDELRANKEQLERQLEEIKRLQEYTEALLSTMNDGLFSIGLDGRLVTINPAACKILDVDSAVIPGTDYRFAFADRPRLLTHIRQRLRRPRGRVQKELRLERDGGRQILLVSSSILEDERNAVFEFVFNVHDITQMKRLEARIRQNERLAALGTLSAGMAHEIRNPLSAIKTFVQLLPRKLDRPGFLEKFNRTVPRELARINQLVEDLLELARDPKYVFERIEVAELVKEVVELMEMRCEEQCVACELTVDDALPDVLADSHQLRKAFQNLIVNAIQAMPSGGCLTIDLLARGGNGKAGGGKPDARRRTWVEIVFRDTGQGIPEEALKNIFNPFFTTKDTGTGLGLAITHKVITDHGGHIEVVSRVGGGATFTIDLPAVDDETEEGIG